jgi:hypothetical protein
VTLPGVASYVAGAPVLTSVSPSSGSAGAYLTLVGTGFGPAYTPAAATVTIGGAPCTVNATSWAATGTRFSFDELAHDPAQLNRDHLALLKVEQLMRGPDTP